MANYYYLITVFPPLNVEENPEISFKELKDMLVMNLTPNDMRSFKRLLRPVDLHNLRALWLGEPLDDRGEFSANELSEELLVGQTLPDYIVDFLERYEETEERLRNFSSLYATLYREQVPKLKGFLRKYYEFERELRLALLGLRAKKAGRDLVRELQFEDPEDPFIAEIIAQRDMPDFTPPRDYEDLKVLFEMNINDPQKLNLAILKYRFDRIEVMEVGHNFGIDRVLAYVAKLMIVESLQGLDKEKGMENLSHYE
jgi:hypothetical protein